MVPRKRYLQRAYQQLITSYVLGRDRQNVFVPMGFGKTSSTLAAIRLEHAIGVEARPALVMGPLRVAQSVWPDEAAKWDVFAGMDVISVVGTRAERVAALRRPAQVYTINYEAIPWLIEYANVEGWREWPFGHHVADESTRLKSFRTRQGSKRAQALKRVAERGASRWTNLTGTPVPNGLQDIWGQQWFIDHGQRLGRSFEAFANRWFQRDFDTYRVRPVAWAMREIQELIADCSMSLRVEDWFDVALPIVVELPCELPGYARALYRTMAREFYAELSAGTVVAANAGVKSDKLFQIAAGALYTDAERRHWEPVHDAKLQVLDSLVSELAGAPLLVGIRFRFDRERILAAFPQARALNDDPQTIRDWNAGKIPMLVLHPAEGGHGLNLQDGGHHVCMYSHGWNLEEYEQLVERIGPVRQFQSGYHRSVYVYNIVAQHTEDVHAIERRASKKDLMVTLLESLKHGPDF
jgi:SNF2 family DNA or RNA helicase